MANSQLDLQLSSKWHSLRPWNHRLSLSVLEITSVSSTFVLSSLSAQTNLSSLLDGEDYEGAENATSRSSGSHQIISDALSKGLSVKVNGTPWQRVLIRIDDETDEAVIIIYGFMPGRQYDIELGIIPGEERVKGHIVTVEARSVRRARVLPGRIRTEPLPRLRSHRPVAFAPLAVAARHPAHADTLPRRRRRLPRIPAIYPRAPAGRTQRAAHLAQIRAPRP
ncbi:hypothetical protein EWM64_g2880 [Hericium alpestre]|uniref:Uncharacterized protein n=1 Tax=Hericium alpestre TaxID=135208 RepID=A0A4Z0A307_9AGAM|nr:hypothetical protein EWM64_g2880 [Hericium alpestre]